MINIFERQFETLSKKIKERSNRLLKRFWTYLRRLLIPIYFFPIKLITYSTYYIIKFSIKFIILLLKIIIDLIIFPFRSLKNILTSIFVVVVTVYMVASLFVIADYLRTQYGWYGKFLCSFGVKENLKKSVVRIVGGNSEGTGFFISPDQVITNFHVIANEPSPKIIFPDGTFVTPIKILGNEDVDLAVLFTQEQYDNLVLPLPDSFYFFKPDEPVIAVGYPLGTELTGGATLLKGRFIDYRKSKQMPIAYIQTDISLVEGMSGGPLVDQCGSVVGINTLGLSGLSLFINGKWANDEVPKLSDQNITKIDVDPSLSPEEGVKAFYTYLKARRMEDGFNLLSDEYLKNTNYDEWTNRFTDILDVDVILTKLEEGTKDTVFVKFSTKNWSDGEVDFHYYEGPWQTVKEDGVYKILKGNIQEVEEPGWEWFYDE